MTLYQDLEARGIVKQVTDPDLSAKLASAKLTLYCGFDPTSDSLHVGSLLPLLTLKRFQQAGHRCIAVVGGATGMIGDPSGKTQERSLLGPEQLAHNVQGIRQTISRFLDFDGPNAAKLANNADWFRDVSYIDFLRDVGKHFTINHMVAKESVRARLEDREHGISYTEFSYMLLQAYDFYVLNQRENCTLQIGGSDQWGNITAGIELIRRMHAAKGGPEERKDERTDVFGLTHPLVSKADGTKFGKTEKGTVWLDPKRTSPYQFYQFFIQTTDADAPTFLRFFTFLSVDEIASLENSIKTEPEKRLAQQVLARELTRLVHGEAELARAEKA
jgi:tyrosyl-tRNA synthetase